MLDAGFAVIKVAFHWELLPRPPQPPNPPKNTVGKWMAASPTPGTIGKC